MVIMVIMKKAKREVVDDREEVDDDEIPIEPQAVNEVLK